MKKFLIFLLPAAIAMGTLSCTKDLPVEEGIIDLGGQSGGGSAGNPYWDWADRFPGPVSPKIDRLANIDVKVKGGYSPIAYAPDSVVLQSTGLYVALGEQITVNVPSGTANLQYQIGIGHSLLDGQFRRRYDNVVKRGALTTGLNTISSYFGGFLYFYYPTDKVAASDITVNVSGAVRSDNYVKDKTVAGEWRLMMIERASLLASESQNEDSTAFLRWTELVSDKVILTTGISELSSISDPNTVLEYYDKIVDAYYRFAGLDQTNQPPMRIYSDLQLPDSKQTALVPAINTRWFGGYPIGFVRGLSETVFEDEKRLLHLDLLQAQNGPYMSWFNLFFGFGETVKSPWQNSPNLLQPSLNIGYYHYARTINKWPGTVFNFASNIALLNTVYARTLSNRDKGIMYGHASNDIRTTMMMQLANHLGWGIFPYISQRARELGFKYEPDDAIGGQAACDFFAMSVCEYADRNMLPFFRIWHFPCSTIAINYMNKFTTLGSSEEFWKTYDGSIIPSFDSKTANKSNQRPANNLKFKLYDSDDMSNWFISGVKLHYQTNDTVTANDCIKAPGWRNVIDGQPATMNGLLGHLQVGTSIADRVKIHIPSYTISFVGSGQEGEPVPNTPLKFNTLALYNDVEYYSTSYIYDIMYYDDQNDEWKPTVPNEFKLLYNEKYEFYYFEEEYSTTKIRFKLQAISPGTSNYSITQIRELGFGLVEEK